jgi:hypothetical protein
MNATLSRKRNTVGKGAVVIPVVLLILSNVYTFFKTNTNAALEIWHAGSRGCCVS